MISSSSVRRRFVGLLLVGSTAGAYQLKKDSTGSVDHWQPGVTFVVDSQLPQQLNEPHTMDAVNAAIASYQAVIPELSIAARAGTSLGIGYDTAPGATNQSEILAVSSWDYDADAIAITIVTVDIGSHRVLDADIALNLSSRHFAVLAAATPGSPNDDIQNTLTHELGHAMGLAHNPDDPSVVMYPSAQLGEVHKRVLQPDDLAGIAYLYPTGGSQSAAPLAGCSSTGAGVAPALLWLLLPLIRRRRSLAALACVASIVSVAAGASENRRAPALVREAAVVATATVEQIRTRPPLAGAHIFVTELEVRVRTCIKGTCPDRLTVLVPGGRWGNLEQLIDGAPVPALGAVLGVTLAPAAKATAPEPRHTGVYRLELAKDFIAFSTGLANAQLRLPTSENPRSP